MKKLKDIPKKEIFDVPEGYFEELPGKIQTRISGQQRESMPAFRLALRYALPAIVLLAVGIFWFNSDTDEVSAESMLASVQTEDLVAFLNEDDISTEELLEDAMLNQQDADDIEDTVYELGLSNDNVQDILDEID